MENLRETIKAIDIFLAQKQDSRLLNYKNIIKKNLDSLDEEIKNYEIQKENILKNYDNSNLSRADLIKSYQNHLLKNIPEKYKNNEKLLNAILGLKQDADKYSFIELKAFERGHLNKDDYFYTQDEQLQKFNKYRTRDRGIIENELNLTPNKEYGVNYAEFYHDGQGAINKLINEAKDYEARKASDKLTQAEKEQGTFKGQVAGAFYRKDLEDLSGTGRIDLVWGDDSFGLKHILQRREAQHLEQGLNEN